MPRFEEAPVETQERDETVLSHPGFGQMSVHRITGQRVLYDSDFKHHHYVRVEIRASQLHRGLSRDWHFPREQIVSVDLSEAQWATFVSSFNIGSGVPCTINSIGGKSVPEFPLRDEGQEYKTEADAKLAASLKTLDDLIETVKANTVGLTKAKAAAILGPLMKTRQELGSNLPFVAEQFGEYMEKRVEKAKIEVNAYMTSTIQRAGMIAIHGEGPLQIEDDDASRT